MAKKTYVLDTNVLLSDSQAIYSFDDNDIVIPMIVLEELDKFKTRQDDVGKNSRAANRLFDELRAQGSITDGIHLASGGTVRVELTNKRFLKRLPIEMQENACADNMIIALMLELKSSIETLVLVSKDINMRIKCDVVGVKCEDYKHERIVDSEDKLYTGVKVLVISDDKIEEFCQNGVLEIDCNLFPNHMVVVKSEDENGKTIRSVLAKHKCNKLFLLKSVKAYGLSTRNKEQALALDLLLDNNVKLVTLAGHAGSGKTILALAAALQLFSDKKYKKIIVTRPIQPMGKEIGFLPGTIEEKMQPWIAPIRDNIAFLTCEKNAKNSHMDTMIQRGELEIEAITYIRGRSIPNAFIIVDEAQNLTPHEVKTILTRVGEGSKIVLNGDFDQIDNTNVNMYTNGLSYVFEKFKNEEIAGHVTLRKGERSELAELAAKLL